MKKAYIFPGQGSQTPGMGKELYDSSAFAKDMFEEANDILGFKITDTMFNGSEEELKQTNITQPAIFIHSVVLAKTGADKFHPDMVAGHSLGEFSALTAAGALTFRDGLTLVAKRANAMQKACEQNPSTMAAILGMEDDLVEKVCSEIDDIVVPANYNSPGQIVISGTNEGVEKAVEALKEKGARRAILLNVGGAFHSPVMEPAREELAKAIQETTINKPICPVYQNATANASVDPEIIRKNLVDQLTAPVRWTQSILNMVNDNAGVFIEVGPGKVLQALVKKIDRNAEVNQFEI